jgi:hypothetical protein
VGIDTLEALPLFGEPVRDVYWARKNLLGNPVKNCKGEAA